MRWTAFITLVVLLGPWGVARAQSPPAPAAPEPEVERSRLLLEAQRAHERGQHEIALGLASEAVTIRESAALWRFVAEQHWLLGNSGAARRASKRCLFRIALEPPSVNRAAVEQGCRFIQAQTIAADHSASRPPRAAPEKRTAGPPAPAGASTGRSRRRSELRTWSTMAIGVGVSALVTAVIARLVANGWFDELKRQCAGTRCPGDSRAIQDRVKHVDALSVGLGVGGGLVAALGVTGVVLSSSRAPAVHGAGLEIVVPF